MTLKALPYGSFCEKARIGSPSTPFMFFSGLYDMLL
jgi:hypothetical protein